MDDIGESEAPARDALLRGDRRGALALLMGQYGTTVYSSCRHILRDASKADDALQTTFIQAFADFPRYRGQSSLRVWLLAIARHRCFDMLKSERREGAHLDRPGTLVDVEADGPNTDERLHLASVGRQMADCLRKLNLQVREAIFLRFTEQLSYEEMSALTGERAATLQMRVARAMSGLRLCLEASGVSL
jgi:RNA polymerase sigma-70 factor, ECF subfamily